MQSECLKFKLHPATQNRCQPSDRADSMVRVNRSTCVSNFRKLSLIREINTGKRAKKLRVNAAREWHIACT